MIKITDPSSYNFDSPIASLVDVHSRGIDSLWAEKRAAAGVFSSTDIKPAKNHALIHLIAMGDAEAYGGNRNGDWMFGYPRKLDLVEPDWEKVACRNGAQHIKNENNFTDTISCGNADRAETFEKYAHVFKNHKNKPAQGHKIYGEVKAAAHNAAVKRVELLIEVPHGRDWDDDLEKLASGSDIPFSMACKVPYDVCFRADTLVETPEGLVKIQDIRVGQYVFTHTGRIRPVLQLFRRAFSGTTVDLTVVGVPDVLKMTHNHPVLLVRQERVRQCWGSVGGKQRRHTIRGGNDTCTTCQATVDLTREWVDASTIKAGDYAVYPVRTPGNLAVDSAFAYLMGVYAGDGSVIYKTKGRAKARTNVPGGVSLSLDEDRDVLNRVLSAAEKVTGRKHTAYAAGDGKKGFVVCVYHAGLATACQRLGTSSGSKLVTNQIFDLVADARWSFLGGCMDSDGSADLCGAANNLRFVSTSMELAWGVQKLLWGLGVGASLNKSETTSGFTGEKILAYFVGMGGSAAQRLREFSAKADRLRIPKFESSRMFLVDGYMHLPVTETRSYHDELDVYNFGVEEDESYLVGIAVHNCLYCGHKAKTLDEYCPHVSQSMGELTKSGHLHGVANDFMTYFDISRVHRPADRIAWSLYGSMTKAASDNQQRVKLAAELGLEAEWGMYPHVSMLRADAPAYVQRRIGLLRKAAEIEKKIPIISKLSPLSKGVKPQVEKVAFKLGQPHRIPEMLRALADNGVCLPLEKWAMLVFAEQSGELLGSIIKHAELLLPGAFSAAADQNAVEIAANPSYDPGEATPQRDFCKVAEDLSGTYGLLPDAVSHRAIENGVRGIVPELRVSSAIVDPLAEGLAREYVSYKLAFLDHVGRSHPDLLDFVLEAAVLEQNLC